MEESRHRLAIYIERMKGLSPLAKLNQGYAYVEDSEGKTLRFVSQAEPGDRIRIYVRDGRILAEVREVCREEYDGSCSENGT